MLRLRKSIALHASIPEIRRVKYSHLCFCLPRGRFLASSSHGFRLLPRVRVPPASGILRPTRNKNQNYKKVDHNIMEFQGIDWISAHGI